MGDKRYTYADYLTWADDERWELIDGVPYMMTPAPIMGHQEISMRLGAELFAQLRGKSCFPYAAPTDVTFEESQDTSTVVQPDLFVLCGDYKRGKRVVDVPALIVEILSPSTSGKDVIIKRALYERMCVREYWIVDGANEIVEVWRHNGERYEQPQKYARGDAILSASLPDVSIETNLIFGEPSDGESAE